MRRTIALHGGCNVDDPPADSTRVIIACADVFLASLEIIPRRGRSLAALNSFSLRSGDSLPAAPSRLAGWILARPSADSEDFRSARRSWPAAPSRFAQPNLSPPVVHAYSRPAPRDPKRQRQIPLQRRQENRPFPFLHQFLRPIVFLECSIRILDVFPVVDVAGAGLLHWCVSAETGGGAAAFLRGGQRWRAELYSVLTPRELFPRGMMNDIWNRTQTHLQDTTSLHFTSTQLTCRK